MKILIIGVGYIGSALLNGLTNHDVFVTTTSPEKIPLLQSQAKRVFLLPDFPEETFDVVITLVAPKKGANYEETYLKTAKRVVANFKGAYFVYTSSTSVYEGCTEVVTENTPLHPHSTESKILKETEEVFLSSHNACVFRLGGIHGEGRTLEKRAAYFSGKTFLTDGSEPTNHSERSQIVEALLFAIDKRLQGVYNLVSDFHPSKKKLYDALCEKQHLPLPLWGQEKGQGYLVSNAKIKHACNLKHL